MLAPIAHHIDADSSSYTVIKEKKSMLVVFDSLTAIALSLFVLSVNGFPRRGMTRRNVRSFCPGDIRRNDGRSANFFNVPPPDDIGRLFLVPVGEQQSDNWTMEEDWALIDNIPQFTVSSATETRTFWAQLWSNNPILFSTRNPEDLYERAQELEQQRVSRRESDKTKVQNDEKTNDRQSASLTFGASPPVLQNWKIDSEGDGNKIVGQLISNASGQRTIWFDYHVIGRLDGDPFADNPSTDVPLFPGGYIEAIGGRLYELGEPMFLDKWETDKARMPSNGQEEKVDASPVRGDGESIKPPTRWWLTGSTAAVSALLSSTILSACIGYGAGLSIIQDSSYHHTPPSSTPTMLTIETVLAGPSQNGEKTPFQPSSTIGTTQTSLSTEELRTRAQYKVQREERLLEKISQRLELDKQNLMQLEQEAQHQSSQLLP